MGNQVLALLQFIVIVYPETSHDASLSVDILHSPHSWLLHASVWFPRKHLRRLPWKPRSTHWSDCSGLRFLISRSWWRQVWRRKLSKLPVPGQELPAQLEAGMQ